MSKREILNGGSTVQGELARRNPLFVLRTITMLTRLVMNLVFIAPILLSLLSISPRKPILTGLLIIMFGILMVSFLLLLLDLLSLIFPRFLLIIIQL